MAKPKSKHDLHERRPTQKTTLRELRTQALKLRQNWTAAALETIDRMVMKPYGWPVTQLQLQVAHVIYYDTKVFDYDYLAGKLTRDGRTGGLPAWDLCGNELSTWLADMRAMATETNDQCRIRMSRGQCITEEEAWDWYDSYMRVPVQDITNSVFTGNQLLRTLDQRLQNINDAKSGRGTHSQRRIVGAVAAHLDDPKLWPLRHNVTDMNRLRHGLAQRSVSSKT